MPRPLLVIVIFLVVAGCARKQHTASYSTRKTLAQELVRQADWERAFSVVTGLNHEDPEDADVLTLRGVIYREQRLGSEAEADLLEAVKRNPRLAPAHAALALLYESQRKNEAALDEHRQALELDPGNAAYANNLGFAFLARGRTREAVPLFQQSLRADPTNRRTRNNLGFAYGKLGEYGRAAEQFNLANGPAEAKHNLAFVYQRAGNLAQAFDLYVEALRLDPGLTAARKNLEEVAKRLQRPVPSDLPADKLS